MTTGLATRLAAVAATVAAAALVTAPATPSAITADDPGFGLQWGLQQIGAPQAWATGDGTGATIAIVDSGVDLAHEDFRRPDGVTRIVGSVSCIGSGGDPDKCTGSAQDDDGHGTHVAGIAAASTGNGKGVAGTAPGAKLLVVRALKRTCSVVALDDTCSASGTASDVEAGIRWAADRGATVINLSIGDTTQSVLGPAFAEALRYAWSKGAIPVVAAGNNFVLSSGFSDEPAVVVAATARDRGAASYSNGVGAAKWAVAAPGGEGERDPDQPCGSDGPPEGILSTFLDPDQPEVAYACQAGTSMAAPHVAGALAILRGAGLRPQEAVDRLLATASDAGSPGRDGTFGEGIVNLAEAVEGLRVSGANEPDGGATPSEQPPPGQVPSSTVPPAPQGTAPTAPPTTGSPSSSTPPPVPGDEQAVTPPPTATPAAVDLEGTVAGNSSGGDQPGGGLVAVAVAALIAAGAGHARWGRRLRSGPA